MCLLVTQFQFQILRDAANNRVCGHASGVRLCPYIEHERMKRINVLTFFFSFFFRILSHFYVGSMYLMRCLHLARFFASSLDNYCLPDKSFVMLSNQFLFGLLCFFSPEPPPPSLSCLRIIIIIIIIIMYSFSLLNTSPYYFKQFSCTFLDISPTFVAPLIISFLILSSFVTPCPHPS